MSSRPDLRRLAAPLLCVGLFPVLLAGCEAEAVELAQEVVAARGDCSPERLKQSDEECVRMMERYAEMGTELVHTYIGGLKSLDRALDRMPPPSFDTAGLGYAISPEFRGGDPSGRGASPRLRSEGPGEYRGIAAQATRSDADQARSGITTTDGRTRRALGDGGAWRTGERPMRPEPARATGLYDGGPAYAQDPRAFRGSDVESLYRGPAGPAADRRARAIRNRRELERFGHGGAPGWDDRSRHGYGIFESGPYGYFYGAPYGYDHAPYSGIGRTYGYDSGWGTGLRGYGYGSSGGPFDPGPYGYGDRTRYGYGYPGPEPYGYSDPYGRGSWNDYGYGPMNGYVDSYAYGGRPGYDARFREDAYGEAMPYDRRPGETYGSGGAAPRDGWGYAPVESSPAQDEDSYQEMEPEAAVVAPAPVRPAPHRPGILLPPEERLRRPWLDD